MTFPFLTRSQSLFFICVVFVNFMLTLTEASGTDSDGGTSGQTCGESTCKISEYCDGFETKCKACIDICIVDIVEFQKCTDKCPNYLRDVVFRRLEGIKTIHTLLAVIIAITSVILIILLALLYLKIRSRKRTKTNHGSRMIDEPMQMNKLKEIEANQMNGHAINITSTSSSPRHHMQLAKGTSMQTMTTAISNIDEESRRHGIDDDDNAHHPRRRQTSSSTNNGGGSKRSYQSSSTFYEQPNRPGIRKPSEDRVPQFSNPSSFAFSSDHGAYDNPISTSSRSPTPTSSNQTLKGTSPSGSVQQTRVLSSPDRVGPNSRLPPIAHPSNGIPRASPYTISHSQVI